MAIKTIRPIYRVIMMTLLVIGFGLPLWGQNSQFHITSGGQVLDRNELLAYQPHGVVTINIEFLEDGQTRKGIDYTQSRVGPDRYAERVLEVVTSWNWAYPVWFAGKSADLTVNMIDRSILLDLSEVWNSGLSGLQNPPIFPDVDENKNAFVNFVGFNNANVNITLSPKYMQMLSKSTSIMELLWERLTPFFFIPFVLLLLLAGRTVAYFLSGRFFFIGSAAVAGILFLLVSSLPGFDLTTASVYWGVWGLLLIYSFYLMARNSSVLNPIQIEGRFKGIVDIEDQFRRHLKETNKILQKTTLDRISTEEKKEWEEKVERPLRETIIQLVQGVDPSITDKKTAVQKLSFQQKINKADPSGNTWINIQDHLTGAQIRELESDLSMDLIRQFSKNLDPNTVAILEGLCVTAEPGSSGKVIVDPKNWPSYPKILYAGLTNFLNNGLAWWTSQEIDRGVDRAIETEIETLHAKGLEVLWSLGSVAPMIGLLGTVVGIAGAFGRIARFSTGIEQSELIHRLAGGINVALYTTIAGLVIGLIALAFYYLIKFNLDKKRSEWENRMVDITNIY